MKKTISINIGGNIFHIEEEGYNKLKAYLDSVHKYFSSFEDSKEIIDDIENRIAEKFYGQLKKNKEAISAVEVDLLIASMGTVADFEATFDDDAKDQKQEAKEDSKQTQKEEGASPSKKLYRDSKRKIFGGVAAGMANYFSIDPLWIRLIWIIFLFSGVGFIAYIIFWVVLPESAELEEKKSLKKFFRNPDERVLGGVSSGIASYFGIDTAVIRLLFIVSIFLGGSGLILYIILWIITPEAKSVTEKMEMKGEPVTMSGIEKNVKKSLKIEDGQENIFVKILLFPFRLVAMVFEGLGRMLGPVMTFIIEAFRVVFGALVLLAGFGIMVSLVFMLLFTLGISYSGLQYGDFNGFPIQDFLTPLGPWAAVSAFFVAFIPALGLTLLGLTVMLKRRVGNAYVALTMLGLWVLAIIGCAVTIPRIVGQFSSRDTVDKEIRFEMTEAIPTFKLNDLGWEEFEYEGVDLRLRGHDDSSYLLVITTEARGSTREQARENTSAVDYQVRQNGDDLLFDSRVTFKEKGLFRFQEVDATLYIPFGKEFKMDQELDEILINTLHLNGYYGYQMGDNTWVFDKGGINCLTCKNDPKGWRSEDGRNERSFDFEDFDEVRISSAFKVKIYQDEDFSVRLKGKRGDLDNVYIQQSEDRLTIRHEDENSRSNSSKDITIYISMPSLNYFKASGECNGSIEDFENSKMAVELSGDTNFQLDVDIRELEVNLSGGSKLDIQGDVREMTAKISGASSLDALDLDAEDVTLDASGKSNAKVFADENITVNATDDSRVVYRGTKNTTINESGESRVRRD